MKKLLKSWKDFTYRVRYTNYFRESKSFYLHKVYNKRKDGTSYHTYKNYGFLQYIIKTLYYVFFSKLTCVECNKYFKINARYDDSNVHMCSFRCACRFRINDALRCPVSNFIRISLEELKSKPNSTVVNRLFSDIRTYTSIIVLKESKELAEHISYYLYSTLSEDSEVTLRDALKHVRKMCDVKKYKIK